MGGFKPRLWLTLHCIIDGCGETMCIPWPKKGEDAERAVVRAGWGAVRLASPSGAVGLFVRCPPHKEAASSDDDSAPGIPTGLRLNLPVLPREALLEIANAAFSSGKLRPELKARLGSWISVDEGEPPVGGATD